MPLLKSGFTLVAVWYIYATLLFLFEHNSDSGVASRYPDILTGLQYALVHLTGDFPIYDYTLPSKAVHIIGVGFGMCIEASFTGIFSAGFMNYLVAERRYFRKGEAERKLYLAVKSLEAVVNLQRNFRKLAHEDHQQCGSLRSQARAFARKLLNVNIEMGRRFMLVANGSLVVNVLKTVIISIPEVQGNILASTVCQIVEGVTGIVFVAEYVVRLVAARNAWKTATKTVRLIDFFCLVPTLVAVSMRSGTGMGIHNLVTIAEIFRIVRVTEFPAVSRVGKRSWKAFLAALSTLRLPAVLAVNLWVITASLWMWLAHLYESPALEDFMGLPDSLYWTCIYLLGEWAHVDFAPGADSRLCIFCCLMGVAIFSIPIGLVVEVVQSIMEDVGERRKEHMNFQRRIIGRGSTA